MEEEHRRLWVVEEEEHRRLWVEEEEHRRLWVVEEEHRRLRVVEEEHRRLWVVEEERLDREALAPRHFCQSARFCWKHRLAVVAEGLQWHFVVLLEQEQP